MKAIIVVSLALTFLFIPSRSYAANRINQAKSLLLQNQEFCGSISHGRCLTKIALEKKDPSICELVDSNVKISSERNFCFRRLAIELPDPELCKNINNSETDLKNREYIRDCLMKADPTSPTNIMISLIYRHPYVFYLVNILAAIIGIALVIKWHKTWLPIAIIMSIISITIGIVSTKLGTSIYMILPSNGTFLYTLFLYMIAHKYVENTIFEEILNNTTLRFTLSSSIFYFALYYLTTKKHYILATLWFVFFVTGIILLFLLRGAFDG